MGYDTAPLRHARLRLVAGGLALTTSLLGIVVLFGWAFKLQVLKQVFPQLVSMKPNTAIGFILGGGALALRVRNAPPPRFLLASQLSAGMLLLLATLILSQDLFDWSLGIDELLFKDDTTHIDTGVSGRSSPATTVCFLLIGLGLLLLDNETRRGLRPSQWLALLTGCVSLLTLLEYLYGVERHTGSVAYTQMALHTALACLFLSVGLLLARPEHGLMTSVTSQGNAGLVARRLLPLAVALLALLGWLRILGEKAGLYASEFGVALLAVSSIVCIIGLIWWTANSLYRSELEQARSARALQQSEERYRHIVETAREGIWTLDHRGHISFVSQRLAEMIGYSPHELVGCPVRELLDPADSEAVYTVGAESSSEGHELRREMKLRRKDGRWLWVFASTTLYTDDETGSPGALTLATDITERRRLVAIRRHAAQIEEQRLRAEQASRLKSEFLANMSHELRTPLNSVIGFAEMLADGKLGPLQGKQKEFLDDIAGSGRHLLQLINDVLDLSKVEAGRMELHPEPIDLPALLNSTVDSLRGLAARKHITLEVESDPALEPLVLDPVRLRQVLYNYLSNGIKFTESGGRVRVRAKPAGPEHFQLEVEDSGIGIRPEDLPSLFQTFKQLDASTSKRFPGTGLGLALTKELVARQGGQVGVRSTPGQGSTFFATLPRVTGPALPRVAMASPLLIPGEDAPVILVVEDETEERQWLAQALVKAGYAVETVPSGEEAVARAAQRRFDAITLDLVLMDIGGLEVARRIREGGLSQDVPIVVITVLKDKRLLSALKVDEVLTKPVSVEQLLETLVRQGASQGRGSKVLVVDDNPKDLKQVELLLSQAGFHPLCRLSGEEGLRAVFEERPAAIILDLMMPGMDGVQFLKLLREDPRSAEVPVVVWTIKDLTSEELNQLLRSAQQVVEKKPGDPSDLMQSLRSVLRPKPP